MEGECGKRVLEGLIVWIVWKGCMEELYVWVVCVVSCVGRGYGRNVWNILNSDTRRQDGQQKEDTQPGHARPAPARRPD